MPRLLVAVTLLAGAIFAWEPTARADTPVGVRVEATVGGGWRTSINANDRNPGFDVGGAQGEVAVGVGWGPFAFLVGGVGRFGGARNATYFQDDATAALKFPTYWEASGNLGFQLSIGDHVRARVGGSGGLLHVVDHQAPIVGGFLALAFDAARFKSSRAALIVTLRLDLDAILGDDQRLPSVSTALGAGFGVRY